MRTKIDVYMFYLLGIKCILYLENTLLMEDFEC